MKRLALSIVLLMGTVPGVTGQDHALQQAPLIRLGVPAGIPSETIKITYFMVGPFGGYGSDVRAEKNRATYDIVAASMGKPAREVKIIAYLPGCRIETFDLQVNRPMTEQPLTCSSLKNISLYGQITPASLAAEQECVVHVIYVADWSYRFFGIADGPVTFFPIGTAIPDRFGGFVIRVPDFYLQSKLGEASLRFTLQCSGTAYSLSVLEPSDRSLGSGRLKVQAKYSSPVRFVAKRMP